MKTLAEFQSKKGGSSQGTVALIETADGGRYMVEQQTNNRIKEAAEGLGITYLPQGRLSGFHAEMRFVKDGKVLKVNFKDAKIWVSKPICAGCADVLTAEGFLIQTSTSPKYYRNWVSPKNGRRTVPKSGRVFRGRRSEVERLKADQPQDRSKRRKVSQSK